MGALGITLAATVLVGSEASADDGSPCGGAWDHPNLPYNVQTCPDWAPRGQLIPVYQSPSPNSPRVGWIDPSGDDWYSCQLQNQSTYTLNGHRNNWWALTKADNNADGWVSQTYFSGGNDFERDGNLRDCGTTEKRPSDSTPAKPPVPAPQPKAPVVPGPGQPLPTCTPLKTFTFPMLCQKPTPNAGKPANPPANRPVNPPPNFKVDDPGPVNKPVNPPPNFRIDDPGPKPLPRLPGNLNGNPLAH